jgi:hypothetical protein
VASGQTSVDARRRRFRAFQEIFERRFRWTVRQVLDVVGETERAQGRGGERFRRDRLRALGAFFGLIDMGIGAFVNGEAFPAQKLADIVPLAAKSKPQSKRQPLVFAVVLPPSLPRLGRRAP